MKTSNFQFLNPYLEEAYFVVNSDYDTSDNNGQVEMRNDFSVQIRRSQNENKANVELMLENNMENAKAPFKMRIRVASDFIWKDLDEERVESMLNLNAPALLLSYMRPIVASLTNSSAFPVYNLPFVNFKE